MSDRRRRVSEQGLARAAQALRIDVLAGDVISRLAEAGIDSILLKGATHEFLYPDEVRGYVDVDVLVRPTDRQPAGAVIAAMGYRDLLAGTAANERPSYADTWVKDGSPAIDLHFEVPLARADAAETWRMLHDEFTEPFEVGGRPVRALTMPGRLLVVALHAAKTGPNSAAGLPDLVRAAEAPVDQWTSAAALARRVDAREGFVAGLRMTAPTAALADELGLDLAIPLALDLSSAGASSPARSVGRLLEADSTRDRIRLVVRAVAPTPTSIRLTSPIANRWSVVGLGLAYLGRPFKVAWRLPRAIGEVRGALARRR